MNAARRWMTIAAALLLALSGCKERLEIRLASQDERLPRPSFMISESARPDQAPRYNTVEVLDGGGAVVWQVKAEVFGNAGRPETIRYGETPAGFEVTAAAGALAARQTYQIEVHGTVASGILVFTTDAEGHVRAGE